MRNFFISFICIFYLNTSAQNIIVDYSVKINKEEGTSLDDVLDTFVFKLFANKTESLFKLEEALQIKDEFKYKLARAIIVDGYNEYYINKPNKEVITRKELGGNFFIIESLLSNDDWKITKETKLIKNFTCFKATRTTQEILNTNRQKVDVLITAWFCPELNYSFGPVGNYGLPGLILQLDNGDKIVYYAKKIEFVKNNISIEIPKKGDRVSEKEFNTIVKELVEN